MYTFILILRRLAPKQLKHKSIFFISNVLKYSLFVLLRKKKFKSQKSEDNGIRNKHEPIPNIVYIVLINQFIGYQLFLNSIVAFEKGTTHD